MPSLGQRGVAFGLSGASTIEQTAPFWLQVLVEACASNPYCMLAAGVEVVRYKVCKGTRKEGRLRSAGLGGSTVSVVYNALGETVERSSTGGVAYRQENLYDPEGRELANYDGADGYWWGRNIALGNRNVALYFSNYVRFVWTEPLK